MSTHTVTARDVPELRADMVADSVDFSKRFPGHHPWYPSHEVADLFWVSKEMRQLAEVAAGSLPEYTVRVEDMPSEHGILVWEDTVDDVAGLAWKTVGGTVALTVLVPRQAAIEIMKGSVDPQVVEKLRKSPVRAPLWSELEMPLPIGTVVYPGGIRLGTTFKTEQDGRWGELMPRMMITMWLLLGQTLATEERVRPSKAGMKRLARLNPDLLMETRYVTLRHANMNPATGSGTGVQYMHRWFVKGHWRNQPYGPGRSQVRPVWIAPHIKGPEGAPILDPSKLVNVLRK